MSMTRKDFELIAEALRDSKPNPGGGYSDTTAKIAWLRTCHSVQEALRSTNPRFDKERFLKACSVEHGA